ncbi:MAG: serine/threonine-protein kinase [Candidatus Acidiferrales bacterium]
MRRIARAAFWVVAAGFFVLFLLEIFRVPGLDRLWPVVQLRSLGTPAVRLVGGWLGLGAGSTLGKFIPLLLALVTVGVKVGVDRLLWTLTPLPRVSAPAPPPESAARATYASPPPAPEPAYEPPRPAPRATMSPPAPAPPPPPRGTIATPHPEASGRVGSYVRESAAAAPSLDSERTAAGFVAPVEVGGVPKRIGRYEVISELGRGAMGAVYKARDPNLGRAVAVKVILTANLTPQALEDYKKRFYREAEAAGRMMHPGVVTIHDMGEDPSTGQPFLVMEFIEGKPLESLLEKSSTGLPLEQGLEVGLQVAEALDYAHQRGVIHRDIKPANIMVTSDGRAKIADFGIAKMEGTQLTQTGQLVGTPAFMSPEQFSGGGIDARSDIFSLGAVLYEMFTGVMPFGGDTVTEVIFKVTQMPPAPACKLNPRLPESVEVMLNRCLAKEPTKRYASARVLADDLKAIKAGRSLEP